MSKIILWVVVGAIVVFGGYSIIKKDKVGDGALNESQEVEEDTNDNTDAKTIAFSQFVKQGGSYKCEVKQAMSDMENSGTVYIGGDKIRGEYTTIAEGRTMSTSFILRDGYSYMWSADMPNMGFKVKVADTTSGTSVDTSGTYTWNADQIGEYDCDPWVRDESKFTLPAGVTFQAMGDTN